MGVVKGKAYNVTAKVRAALRKAWQWSPMRQEALTKARVSYGLYRCQGCGGLFGAKQVAVDHVHMVTADGGGEDWNKYIMRLFCPTSELQILCKDPCHNAKTKQERAAKKKAKAA